MAAASFLVMVVAVNLLGAVQSITVPDSPDTIESPYEPEGPIYHKAQKWSPDKAKVQAAKEKAAAKAAARKASRESEEARERMWKTDSSIQEMPCPDIDYLHDFVDGKSEERMEACSKYTTKEICGKGEGKLFGCAWVDEKCASQDLCAGLKSEAAEADLKQWFVTTSDNLFCPLGNDDIPCSTGRNSYYGSFESFKDYDGSLGTSDGKITLAEFDKTLATIDSLADMDKDTDGPMSDDPIYIEHARVFGYDRNEDNVLTLNEVLCYHITERFFSERFPDQPIAKQVKKQGVVKDGCMPERLKSELHKNRDGVDN